MQRSIEFRIWDKTENYWLPSDDGIWFEVKGPYDSLRKANLSTLIKCVNAFSVQQFTGILDKNGKKIFEGDIVRLFDFNGGIFRKAETVVFRSACFCFETDCRSIGSWNLPIEVIGNIFENSELLK